MALTNKEKLENVKEMITQFGEMLRDMPDSKLREEFNTFVYALTFGRRTLPEIIEIIEKKIATASSVLHQDLETNAKVTSKFWTKIKDIIVKTYQENKDA